MNRTSAQHRLSAAAMLTVVATMLAALASFGLPARVAAADPVTLQARALMAGRFEAGGWAALSVRLENTGEPLSGYLAADTEDGTARRFVELPAGSVKQVTLYVRPEAFARTIAIRFETDRGEELATSSADLRVLERTGGNIAVVGDGGGNLRPQIVSRAQGLPEPFAMTAADIPERPEPLRGLETLVWAGDSTPLADTQRRALERWVASGGQLVVLGGPDWQSRTAAFADWLPVSGLRAVDGVSAEALGSWAGAEPPEADAMTASLGTAVDGAMSLVRTEAGDVLAAAASRGAGRVTWIGMDLATEAFRSWPGAPSLWARLIPDDRIAIQFGGGAMPEEEVGFILAQALQNLPALEVPPAELLLAVLVAYILLIGPVSYVVLRRIDRRELAWITAPVLVITFSAGTYGIGASMKGSDVILNEVALIRTTDGAGAASVSTYAGVYSPTRSSYDLVARSDALFSALANPFDGGLPTVSSGYLTEQGDPSRLHGLAVGVFGMQAIRADSTIPYSPALSVDWSMTADGGAAGTISNGGTEPIEDVAVVTASGGVMVGKLDPGESRDFELARRNLLGNSASEQIYGFAGVDVSSDEQRRIATRRSVIDALIGYGGMRGLPSAPINGVDIGPFVIGWTVGTAPVVLEVDGQDVQHYSQAVEIISTRPTFAAGEVTVLPSQMITHVVSTAGDASQPEPGYVTVGEGEVVFQVALPLEASGLRPSKVTLIAASDAGAIYFNQGNVSSLLPSGYRMSVLDLTTGEWVDVGDLSRGSRFDIADPDSVLDVAGRIQVRISGSEIPEAFGQMPVFAGATVTGVIGS